jgi:hypothetical protein
MEFGDRLFWGVMVFIGICLFWLGALEKYLPIWVGAIAGIIGLLATIRFVPRPKGKESEAGE